MKKTLIILLFFVIPFHTALYGKERQKNDIGSGWKFKSNITGNDPSTVSYNDASWSTVKIPHTWNQTDAQDGGDNYLRTTGWYRKMIPWSDEFSGKKLYLELLGANMQAECFVNGVSAGNHKGGYTAFRFDITDQMTQGNNIIAIKVDNRYSEEIAPLSGDFSFFGGIYRKIFLIVVNPVHVDLTDNGSQGLYLTTSHISKSSADLEIKAKIVNTSNTPKEVTLNAIVRKPDTFTEIAGIPRPVFNVNEMKPGGNAINDLSETVTILANNSYEFKQKITLNNPHLWNGKKDPFRYLVDFTVSQNGTMIDALSEYVGFRHVRVDKTGFYLNGELYPLRGVNRHQDRVNRGNAITEKEHDEDFGMIYEIGANTIRLAHYPQDPYMYDLCDRYGLVVWAEIPFVNNVGTAATFGDVTKSQLREMIRQQYNRPSICFWGLQNEVRSDYDSQMRTLMTELNNLAHAEDPSRLTVQATNHGTANNWASDVIAWNTYPGWYGGGSLGGNIDGYKSASRPTGVSEYGAGANINQHEIDPAQPSTTGYWHPEEYQNIVHENAIKDITARNYVWGTFLWNMFDFASDYRAEGNQPGINDKGLVTYDRKVKKDAFYAYKVNWNPEPEIYISSRRFVERESTTTPVTVYSNCKTVELFVNGASQGKKELNSVQCGIFKWNTISLRAGNNEIRAEGTISQDKYTDQVIWERK